VTYIFGTHPGDLIPCNTVQTPHYCFSFTSLSLLPPPPLRYWSWKSHTHILTSKFCSFSFFFLTCSCPIFQMRYLFFALFLSLLLCLKFFRLRMAEFDESTKTTWLLLLPLVGDFYPTFLFGRCFSLLCLLPASANGAKMLGRNHFAAPVELLLRILIHKAWRKTGSNTKQKYELYTSGDGFSCKPRAVHWGKYLWVLEQLWVMKYIFCYHSTN
jgi:hypothetical protein